MTVMNVPVVIAAACSCLGDMIVILTLFTVPAGTSLNFSVRHVAYLSMANLLSSAIGLYNNSGAALPRPPICAALGMLEWWSTWSTWLWTAAIAHAFHKAFRERSLEVSIRTERCNHLICWFVPAVLLLVAIFTGSEFGGDGEPGEDICGWMFPTQNVTRARRAEIDIASDVLIDGVQLTVLLFNVWEFICVDLLLRGTAALAGIGTGGIGGAREAGSVALLELPPPPVARRPNLWPTFAGYILAFVVSQSPGAVWDIFADFDPQAPQTEPGVQVLLSVLMYSHGWLNAIVYGVSNKLMLEQWLRWPRRLYAQLPLPRGQNSFRTSDSALSRGESESRG